MTKTMTTTAMMKMMTSFEAPPPVFDDSSGSLVSISSLAIPGLNPQLASLVSISSYNPGGHPASGPCGYREKNSGCRTLASIPDFGFYEKTDRHFGF